MVSSNYMRHEELEAVTALVKRLNDLDNNAYGVLGPVTVKAQVFDVNGDSIGYVVYNGRDENYVYSKTGRID